MHDDMPCDFNQSQDQGHETLIFCAILFVSRDF